MELSELTAPGVTNMRVPHRLLVVGLLVLCGTFLCVVGLRAKSDQFRKARQSIESTLRFEFDKPVPLETQSDTDFKAYLERELNRVFAGENLARLRKVYHQLGFLPADFSLREKLKELYQVQAGAYYDPRTGTIYQLQGDLPGRARYFIYLHELVHAYQDQKFDLSGTRRQLVARGDMDARLSFSFVFEGHANLVALAALTKADLHAEKTYENSPLARLVKVMSRIVEIDLDRLVGLFGQRQQSAGPLTDRVFKQLREVPDLLFQMLLDPYLMGQRLWFDRARKLGWESAETWLAGPPAATRELIYQSVAPEPNGTAPAFSETPAAGKPVGSLGVYTLLRWLDELVEPPDWGAQLTDDRVFFDKNSEGEFVYWQLKFKSREGRDQFLSELGARLAAPGGAVPGDFGPASYQLNDRKRYVHVLKKERSLVLVVSTRAVSLNKIEAFPFPDYESWSLAPEK